MKHEIAIRETNTEHALQGGTVTVYQPVCTCGWKTWNFSDRASAEQAGRNHQADQGTDELEPMPAPGQIHTNPLAAELVRRGIPAGTAQDAALTLVIAGYGKTTIINAYRGAQASWDVVEAALAAHGCTMQGRLTPEQRSREYAAQTWGGRPSEYYRDERGELTRVVIS